MFRRLLPLLLLIVTLLIDISVVPMIWATRYVPMFSLMTVVVLGLLLGRTRGSMYGLIGGLMLDILVGSPLGLMAAIFVLCGFVTGIMGRRYQRYLLTPVIAPLICFGLYELVLIGYLYLAGARIETTVFRDALIRASIAVICTQLMYLLYDRILKPSWSRFAGR